MDLEFYTVDVFSNKIFGGNPLAIFTNTDDISSDLMQSIASEVNYSETVFIQKPKKFAIGNFLLNAKNKEKRYCKKGK